MLISSVQNPAVKEVRALYSKKARRESGRTVVEGLHPLEEALRAGWRVETALHTAEFAERDGAGRLGVFEQLRAQGTRLVEVTPEVLSRTAETGTPQGVIAVLSVREVTLREIVGRPDAEAKPQPLLLVCDGLQDPGNLGTLWRTAHAFGAFGILLTKGSAEAFSPKVIRSAAGSVFHLPVVTQVEAADAVAALRKAGYRIVVADAERGQPPHSLDLTGPLAMVVGSEAAGPSREFLDGADLRTRIPMPGEAESLNAAVAGAVLLYEALRQRLD